MAVTKDKNKQNTKTCVQQQDCNNVFVYFSSLTRHNVGKIIHNTEALMLHGIKYSNSKTRFHGCSVPSHRNTTNTFPFNLSKNCHVGLNNV